MWSKYKNYKLETLLMLLSTLNLGIFFVLNEDFKRKTYE